MLLNTRRKLNVQVSLLGVANVWKLPISAFQASLNTTEHMFVFGVEMLLSTKGRNYTPTWYSEYAMNWNICGSDSGRGYRCFSPEHPDRFWGRLVPIWCSWSVKVTIYWNPLQVKMIGARILHPLFILSQYPRGLRRGSTTICLLWLWVRIPPKTWKSFSCECCVLSDRVFCDRLITRPEESYRVWCVWILT